MLRLLDAFRDSEEWDSLVPKDPHYASAYYRGFGSGQLAVLQQDGSQIVQPFRRQEDGWVGNAYNYGGPVGSFSLGPHFASEFDNWKAKEKLKERCTLCPFVLGAVSGRELTRREVVITDSTEIKIRATTRHQIEKAQKFKAECHFFTAKDVQHVQMFEDMYNAAMLSKQAAAHWFYPEGFFYCVLNEMGPERSALILTTLDGMVESGCVIIFDKKVCYYHWAASYRQRASDGANHFQVWNVMDWAQDKGMAYVHLGGGLTPEKDSLFTFKTGFSRVTRDVFSYTTSPE